MWLISFIVYLALGLLAFLIWVVLIVLALDLICLMLFDEDLSDIAGDVIEHFCPQPEVNFDSWTYDNLEKLKRMYNFKNRD